uniref:Uncharacterized protein LOC102803885 n=1 Tax=Saccoglossus kowalevskii TaxID=10224 RepID=A0ABM0MZU4_SACKO|nr:PREDICTED: uncharacterized protein LOC102803885 [Saccoglossus kowalevskii]
MKLEFAVAEGFSNSDDKHWEDMKRAYDAIVLQRVDFDQSQTGNKDISMYFPRNVQRHHHDYANIEPNKTIRIRSKKSRSYENRLDIDSEPRMNNSPDHTNAKTSIPAPAPPVGKSLDPPIFSEDGITLVKKEARSEPAKNDFTKKKNKKEKNTSGVNKSGPNRGGKSDKRYKSLSELPSDLTKLTVGQVGDLLRLLDLELWVALFDENGVDGELLRKLTAVQLTENFKLPRVDALKITTYYMENHKEKKKKFALF